MKEQRERRETVNTEGVRERGKGTWNWIPPREFMEPLAGVPHEELTTIKAAMREANCGDGRIYNRMRSGELPFTRIDGIYFIRRADVDTLRERHPPGPKARIKRRKPAKPEGYVGDFLDQAH